MDTVSVEDRIDTEIDSLRQRIEQLKAAKSALNGGGTSVTRPRQSRSRRGGSSSAKKRVPTNQRITAASEALQGGRELSTTDLAAMMGVSASTARTVMRKGVERDVFVETFTPPKGSTLSARYKLR